MTLSSHRSDPTLPPGAWLWENRGGLLAGEEILLCSPLRTAESQGGRVGMWGTRGDRGVRACGLWAGSVHISAHQAVSGSHAGPEGQEEFCSPGESGRWVRKRRRGGRGCRLALTLVALQGGGLGAELPEHGLHAPLEVQLHIWAAGVG